MEILARVLGIAEFFLVPFSVLWLLYALHARSWQRSRRAVTVALILAVTVAQPFGVVATERAVPPSGAHPVAPTSIHIARLFGVLPVLPFALYRQEIIYSAENTPTAMLKARSWFWLPILTNATTIQRICSDDISTPCWQTRGPDPDSERLRLFESGGRYYVSLLRAPYAPAAIRGSLRTYTWELAPGIASPIGLIYWAVLAILIPRILRTRGDRAPTPRRAGNDD